MNASGSIFMIGPLRNPMLQCDLQVLCHASMFAAIISMIKGAGIIGYDQGPRCAMLKSQTQPFQ